MIGTASAGRAFFLALDTLTWVRRLAGSRFGLPGRWCVRVRCADRAGQANLATNARRVPARDPDQPVAPAVWRGTVKYERTPEHERTTEHPDWWRPGDSLPVGVKVRPPLVPSVGNGAAIGRWRDANILTLAHCESIRFANATTGRPSLCCADSDADAAAKRALARGANRTIWSQWAAISPFG